MRDVDDDQILDDSVDVFELIPGLGTEAKVPPRKFTQPKGLSMWVFSRLEGYANKSYFYFSSRMSIY